jgi:hypothetical protein
MNSKWITDQNENVKLKCLGKKKQGRTSQDPELGKEFLDLTPNTYLLIYPHRKKHNLREKNG